MPRIFLSPSTQEYNPYVTGGNEELYANLIADAMEPYLRASGIDFTRNDPNGSVSTSIAASNAGNYDFHLAIHSNAAPANLAGMLQGPDVYYYRDSSRSRAAAEIFANNLKLIYPNPDLVTAVPTTSPSCAAQPHRLCGSRSPIMTMSMTPTGSLPTLIVSPRIWRSPLPTTSACRL